MFKRILTSLCAVVCLCLAVMPLTAQAAVVTIASVTLGGWQDKPTNTVLRIVASGNTVTKDGSLIQQGSLDSGPFYQVITCTVNVSAQTITIPAFNLESTTDALTNQTIKYTAAFYAGSTRISVYQASFYVPTNIA